MFASSPVSASFRHLSKSPRQPAIRIVTYNILAEKYSGNNAYCPQQYLNWEYRCQLLLRQLEAYSPDLLCLQEVQEDVYQDVLQPWMQQHGYGSLYNPRLAAAGSTTGGPMDGVSLHFRNSMFSLAASQQVRFADHAAQLLPASCCSLHQPWSSDEQGGQNSFMDALMQRQEGAVLALLQHKPSQQQLVACSTHLHWNPNFPDVKLAQAAILCHRISTFSQQQHGQRQQEQRRQQQQQSAQDPQQQQQQQQQQVEGLQDHSMPVVVGGDFNSTWRKYISDPWDQVPAGSSILSGVYELMSHGLVTPYHRDHPSRRRLQGKCMDGPQDEAGQGQDEQLLQYTFHSSGLQLESSQFSAYGREPTLTTRTSTFSGCLDYIWLSKQHWQVQSTLELPFQEPEGPPGPPDGVTTLGPCPNAEQPSDHLPIGCEAVLLPALSSYAQHESSAEECMAC